MSGLVGRTLLNRYRVQEFIAAGGLGAVYKVWDQQRQAPLAMKVLHAEISEDPIASTLFQRDAQALQRLEHPNIVRFYGAHKLDDDSEFLLMQYIEGPTFKRVLSERRALPIDEALIYLQAMCAALGFAHENGLIHCDVKPGNVLIDRGGSIYLTDFGIARHAESTQTSMLSTAGTAAYMSPEQCVGAPVSARTDVYSLGVMLYEMVVGRRPFMPDGSDTGRTAAEQVRYAHVNLPMPDPRQINPAISYELSGVLGRAMAKEPQQRFGSMNEFYQAALKAAGVAENAVKHHAPIGERYFNDEQTFIEGIGAPPMHDAQMRDATMIDATGVEAPRKRSWVWVPAVIGLGACLFVAALGVGGLAYGMRDGRMMLPWDGAATSTSSAATEIAVASFTDTPPPSDTATSTEEATETSEPEDTPTPSDTPNLTPTVWVNEQGYPLRLDAKGHEMVFIEPATFNMGTNDLDENERPVHQVRLTRGFWFDVYEVTNAQFEECVDAGVCIAPYQSDSETRSDYYGNDEYADYPVIYVTWFQANAFCIDWRGGRLPTEAEWEYVARAGTDDAYPWGDLGPTCDLANFSPDGGACIGDTNKVGSYPDGVSPFGVHDMAGNVWEWIYDWYAEDYYSYSSVENPDGPDDGIANSVRGGSWFNGAGGIRSAYRFSDDDIAARPYTGFRCVSEGRD